MGIKRARWGDNPLRGWFRVGKKIIRVLCWDNYEPCETSRGSIPPRQWWILRKSKPPGVHLKNYEIWYPDWLRDIANELLAGKALYS
jgi:hypothetical protein